jgi:hypothetical protein
MLAKGLWVRSYPRTGLPYASSGQHGSSESEKRMKKRGKKRKKRKVAGGHQSGQRRGRDVRPDQHTINFMIAMPAATQMQ